MICNFAFFLLFSMFETLWSCVHLSYAEAGCKLNNC
jgi:hypothetical protein